MKALILVLLTTSFSVFANETHSPQFKCVNGDVTKFMIIGNKFQGGSDFDWSNEIYVAEWSKYSDSSFRQTPKYTLVEDSNSKLTAVNIENPAQVITFDKAYNLTVQDGENVDHYVCTAQNSPDKEEN